VSVTLRAADTTLELPPSGRPRGVAFVARVSPASWPATCQDRDALAARLTRAPFVLENRDRQSKRALGVKLLLSWLTDQPGSDWQQRWLSSGADAAPATWRELPAAWLAAHGLAGPWRHSALVDAMAIALCADVVRPSLGWLVGGGFARGGLLARNVASRDPEGFARLRRACADDAGISALATARMRYRSALIVTAKGGGLDDITVGDVIELFATEDLHVSQPDGRAALYSMLRQLGIFDPGAPPTLRAMRTYGQDTPDELIDRYHLACRPVRDLLVDYLRERQPALDYTSLNALANFLGKLFWADLERHHPGIDDLRLSRDVADGWKRRLRTIPKTTTTATGKRVVTAVERINYRECLTPVRAFYLDLAHWAVEDPGRWAPWVAPCPISDEEINRKKSKRRLKARMDARTRERLPVLPIVVRSVEQRRDETAAILHAARDAEPGQAFTAAGTTLVRSVIGPRSGLGKVWADDPTGGARRNLTREEDHAFWAWAVVEVLRATGIRAEELLELSHHSLVSYRLPTTGEQLPLLQIVPSKTDAERLLVVSPALADVLSTIIRRVRSPSGAVPLVSAYDQHERLWSPPAPRLFQHHVGTENRAFSYSTVRNLLTAALAHSGLIDPADGEPLHYTPHDFRRMFITDAIMNGLPPHIAQIIAGHRDINVTLGYKAVYPEEAIEAHLAFLARRRSLRPSEEYRVPTDDEWQEFLGHFERRQVSIGTCARAFSTPCIHEHACVRCPMLWPDPNQQPRLIEIRDNLTARVAEAQTEGWAGEVEGLQISLAGANNKLAQIDNRLNVLVR
jgi:integrase